MRKIVEEGYDRGDYAGVFRRVKTLNSREKRFFHYLITDITPQGKVLDLGCGPGIPYDKYLVEKGIRLTGIDLSKKHIALAKKNVPAATYEKADFSRISFPAGSFDAIISLYAIFHVPREEHFKIFKKINTWLKPGGLFLVTLGITPTKLGIEHFVGATMAWSSYSLKENKNLLKKAGFTIVLEEEEHGEQEHHLWILARKE